MSRQLNKSNRGNTVDKTKDFFIIAWVAKQAGILKITGTINNICFYKLEREFYARTKSSLSGKRVKRDPAFKETMKYAGLLSQASVIASAVYHLLPKERKGRKIYQQLTGKAIRLLKKDINKKEILKKLKGSVIDK